jgi:hypothetical protein
LDLGVMKSLFYCPGPAQTDGLPQPVWGTMTWWELVKSGVKCQGIHKQRRAEKLKRNAESQPRGFAAKKRGGNWK